MTSDPVADLIIRIKNASEVGKSTVSVPYSTFKHAIAEKLAAAGYVKGIEKKGKKIRKTLDVTLKYDDSGRPAINGLKRISKPGCRLYRSAHQIIPVRYGHGTLILSTPKGILTGTEARREKIGGEALLEIW